MLIQMQKPDNRGDQLDAWLRQQREARCWPRSEMARHLVNAAIAHDDTAVPRVDNVIHNIVRWETGKCGPSENYVFYYCHVFGIPRSEFGRARSEDEVSVSEASAGDLAMMSLGLMAGMLGLRYESDGETLTIRRREGDEINIQLGVENAVNLICSILKSGAGAVAHRVSVTDRIIMPGVTADEPA